MNQAMTLKIASDKCRFYSPVYVLMKLTPYLPSVTDDNAKIGVYLVNDFVNTTHTQVNCSIR
jgi:hypothetical protein